MVADRNDKDVAKQRLLELLAERTQPVAEARRAQLDTQIAVAASILGLEAEEVASRLPGVARHTP